MRAKGEPGEGIARGMAERSRAYRCDRGMQGSRNVHKRPRNREAGRLVDLLLQRDAVPFASRRGCELVRPIDLGWWDLAFLRPLGNLELVFLSRHAGVEEDAARMNVSIHGMQEALRKDALPGDEPRLRVVLLETCNLV